MLAPHLKGRDFSTWARRKLLDSLRAELPAAIEAAAAISEEQPRESLVLPPWGDEDADGCRYHWAPRHEGARAGTLTIATPRGAKAVDLVEVDVIALDDGTLQLSFADRSLVRDVAELPEGLS